MYPVSAPSLLPPLEQRAGSIATPGVVISLIGAAIVVFGSLMPWATVSVFGSVFTVNGLDGDGKFSIAAGLGIAVLALWALKERHVLLPVIWLLGAVGCAFISWVNVTNISDIASQIGQLDSGDTWGDTYVKSSLGLYLVGLGGLIALIGGIIRITER